MWHCTVSQEINSELIKDIVSGLVTKEYLEKEPGGPMYIEKIIEWCKEKISVESEKATEAMMSTQIGDYDKTSEIIALKEYIFYTFDRLKYVEKCIEKLK